MRLSKILSFYVLKNNHFFTQILKWFQVEMHNGRFKRYTGSYKEGLNNWRHPIIIELTYIVKKIQTYV